MSEQPACTVCALGSRTSDSWWVCTSDVVITVLIIKNTSMTNFGGIGLEVCDNNYPGMWCSRTVLILENTSRTNFGGLGLEVAWPWPWSRGSMALALTMLSLNTSQQLSRHHKVIINLTASHTGSSELSATLVFAFMKKCPNESTSAQQKTSAMNNTFTARQSTQHHHH